MKQFSKEQIDAARNYFRGRGFSEMITELNEKKLSYFVLPETLEPNVPDFVCKMSGGTLDGHLFGVSSNVNEEFRPHAMSLIYMATQQNEQDYHRRYLEALERELSVVPDYLQQGYILPGQTFLQNPMGYFPSHPDNFIEGDLGEIRESFMRLDEML